MGCSRRWTIFYLAVTIWASTARCQNTYGGQSSYQAENNNREPNLGNASSRSQLMNTLLTVAAANGVLSDLLPFIQPSLSNELPKEIPNTLNVVQMPCPNHYQRPQEPEVPLKPVQVSQTYQAPQPVVTPITVSPYPYYNSPLQTTFTPSATQSNVCPVPQAMRYEKPQTSYSSAGIVQPIPATWQQPVYVSPEAWYQRPTVHEAPEMRPLPVNLQISPPINEPERENAISVEEVPASHFAPYVQIGNDANEGSPSLPMNLQINLPALTSPTPQITVVSSPNQRSSTESTPPRNPYPPFYQPPIVIERSDSLNHLLPIIMLLVADQGNNGGCGCNCCCNSSKSVVPIPYPVPFPMNNAVINKSGRSKSKKSNSEDEEDESNKR